MADPFIARLDAISHPGTSAADFLKKLGPIHVQWHHDHNLGTVGIGFLLFHWELIERFRAVNGPAFFGGVTAFTPAQLDAFHAAYDVSATAHAGDIPSLESFSDEVESWHNNAHMAIGWHSTRT